jgi:hypothetical protein
MYLSPEERRETNMLHSKHLQSLRKMVGEFSAEYEISRTKSGHYAVRIKGASGLKMTVFAPSTPSDHRSMLNVKTKIRHAAAA